MEQFTAEEFEMNRFLRIRVGQFINHSAGGNLDGKFLLQLAPETLFERFIYLALATGKLP